LYADNNRGLPLLFLYDLNQPPYERKNGAVQQRGNPTINDKK
jgi:hypothetical protein